VVIATADDSRWENLSKVWSLVHEDRSRFNAYLGEHISAFLEADQ
jgi:hypothetical protein